MFALAYRTACLTGICMQLAFTSTRETEAGKQSIAHGTIAPIPFTTCQVLSEVANRRKIRRRI